MKNLTEEFEGVIELAGGYGCSICRKIYSWPEEAKKCFDKGFLGPEIKPGLIVRRNKYDLNPVDDSSINDLSDAFSIFVAFREQFSQLNPKLANIHSKGYFILNVVEVKEGFFKKNKKLRVSEHCFDFLYFENVSLYSLREESIFNGKLIDKNELGILKEKLSPLNYFAIQLKKANLSIDDFYNYNEFFDKSKK